MPRFARVCALFLLTSCYQHHERVEERDAATEDAPACAPDWRDVLVAVDDDVLDVDVHIDDRGEVTVVWGAGHGAYRATLESGWVAETLLADEYVELVELDPTSPRTTYAYLRIHPDVQVVELADGEVLPVGPPIWSSWGRSHLSVSHTALGPIVAFRRNELSIGWASRVGGRWEYEVVDFMGYFGFDARADPEGRRVAARVSAPSFLIHFDAGLAPAEMGVPAHLPRSEQVFLRTFEGGAEAFALTENRPNRCAVFELQADATTLTTSSNETPIPSCPTEMAFAEEGTETHLFALGNSTLHLQREHRRWRTEELAFVTDGVSASDGSSTRGWLALAYVLDQEQIRIAIRSPCE